MKTLFTTTFVLSCVFTNAQNTGYAKAIEMGFIDTTKQMSYYMDTVNIVGAKEDNQYYTETDWRVADPKEWKLKGSWDKKYFRKSF